MPLEFVLFLVGVGLIAAVAIALLIIADRRQQRAKKNVLSRTESRPISARSSATPEQPKKEAYKPKSAHGGGKHVICALVWFHEPGPSPAEQRREILTAFGTVRNAYGLTMPEGIPMAGEVRHIPDVHDYTNIYADMKDVLADLGLVGDIQAVGLETDNPRFRKVQVAWATE